MDRDVRGAYGCTLARSTALACDPNAISEKRRRRNMAAGVCLHNIQELGDHYYYYYHDRYRARTVDNIIISGREHTKFNLRVNPILLL